MKNEKNSAVITRRSFIKVGGMSVAVVVASGPLMRYAVSADPGAPRRLVILEQNGGNDGLNTLIPYGDSAYYDNRGGLAIPEKDVLQFKEIPGWGLHPSLGNLKDRFEAGHVAAIRGIGVMTPFVPDLSHFEMMTRWRSGNDIGFSPVRGRGWVGRLLENLFDHKSPIAALSISSGVSPMLIGDTDKSASAASSADGQLDIPDRLREAFLRAMEHLSLQEPGSIPALVEARKGIRGGLDLSNFLINLPEPSPNYPNTGTGQLLAFAASVLKVNDWVRVIHVPLPLDHDTHVNQLPRQAENLSETDQALHAFLDEMEKNGLGEQVVVATTSEFSRRVAPNGELGTDHGTANTVFYVGNKVRGGLYNEAPSLKDLYEDGDLEGNLKATGRFVDHLATAASYMGIKPSEMELDGKPFEIFT